MHTTIAQKIVEAGNVVLIFENAYLARKHNGDRSFAYQLSDGSFIQNTYTVKEYKDGGMGFVHDMKVITEEQYELFVDVDK